MTSSWCCCSPMARGNRSRSKTASRSSKSRIHRKRIKRCFSPWTIRTTRTCTTSPPIWRRSNKRSETEMNKFFLTTVLAAAPVLLLAQSGGGLDPADILKPLSDQWTSYSGDMTGKRYSAIKEINTETVKNLSLQWINTGITTGCGPNGTGPAGGEGGGFGGGGRGGRGGGGGFAAGQIVVGGFGTGEVNSCGPTRFGGGILFVDGVLYGASQNDVYAIDARDGSVLWHYYWKYRGGTTTSISSSMTTGWFASMQRPAAKSGRRKSLRSSSSISRRTFRW